MDLKGWYLAVNPRRTFAERYHGDCNESDELLDVSDISGEVSAPWALPLSETLFPDASLLYSSFQTMVLKNAKERLMAVERQMSMSQ